MAIEKYGVRPSDLPGVPKTAGDEPPEDLLKSAAEDRELQEAFETEDQPTGEGD